MYTHLKMQKLSNAYRNYSSNKDEIFEIDKLLVTNVGSFQQLHEEHAV